MRTIHVGRGLFRLHTPSPRCFALHPAHRPQSFRKRADIPRVRAHGMSPCRRSDRLGAPGSIATSPHRRKRPRNWPGAPGLALMNASLMPPWRIAAAAALPMRIKLPRLRNRESIDWPSYIQKNQGRGISRGRCLGGGDCSRSRQRRHWQRCRFARQCRLANRTFIKGANVLLLIASHSSALHASPRISEIEKPESLKIARTSICTPFTQASNWEGRPCPRRAKCHGRRCRYQARVAAE